MDKELKVYDRIYDITKNNLERAGMEMAFTKDAFLYSTKRDLTYINVFDLVNYDNETLLQVLYIAFFFRTPEKEARRNWGAVKDLSIQEFQKKIFKTLSSSQEYMRNGTIICNNIFGDTTVKLEGTPINTGKTNVYIEKLYTYYRKIPLPLQRLIKKILVK